MSGHSKWAQIKHKKAITDAKRGRLFSKIMREILVAARSGGPNPDMNPRLRAAIERARSLGLPKDNIERGVERASGSESAEVMEEFLYEAVGPSNASILIEGITDNRNRSFNEIRRMLQDYHAKIAEPRSLSWNFEKMGMIEVAREENKTQTPDAVELAIVESGALDFDATDYGWMMETKFLDQERVRHALEERGIAVRALSHDYQAKNLITVTPEDQQRIDALSDALCERDDVQDVYTNIIPNADNQTT